MTEPTLKPLSKHGGPQSWSEMRRGIQRRKETVKHRNAQIWDLKGKLSSVEKELADEKKRAEKLVTALEALTTGACEKKGCSVVAKIVLEEYRRDHNKEK